MDLDFFQIFIYALYFYGMKFLFSLINVTIMAAFNLRWICENLENMNHTCAWVYPILPSQLLIGEGLKG